ncbi:MAG: ATP-binding protein [Verrucomicrobiaceae bacterium]|nr:ATP-binding protein [Verrucomicrobiaceae bacterium]
MTITPDQYEKLGSFYLGRGYDIDSKALKDDLVLYDSKDIVTHGVVLGMTGSGKTGLCLAMLEEAAMDGIPVIAIDPKGDIGNLMFTFPELSGEKLKPWVNEDDARRKSMSVDDYANAQADLWKKGLGEWGQSQERIKKLRETVDMNIYTPGSNAGIPVSILSSLAAPGDEIMEDAETLADRIESTVSSVLALCGIEADPVQSPEHILLSNIVRHCWGKRQNLTIENLVRLIQQPPIRKIGVENVDNFFPEEGRNKLAMKLNNLIASPGFGVWLEGEPLDIQRMMYTPDGKPRISIFCISHLGDTERMFFVALLLNQLLGWMRQQAGTTSLRAMFYMDEIFGYLPPTASPPSKKPMMILLKQARAFGLGILLATQNPVDLDYKALSNIGTWFLGRLQTERDKARVLDGLEGAISSQGGGFDRAQIDRMLAALGNRVFLMNNVHEDGPFIFHVRWVMTYLRGPLARGEIKKLMDPLRPKPKQAEGAKEDDGFLPPGATSGTTSVRNTHKPKLPEEVEEYFFTPEAGLNTDHICYIPAVIQSAAVVIDDAKRKISGRSLVTRVNKIDVENQKVNWEKAFDLPNDLDVTKLAKSPEDGEVEYGDLPGAAMKAKTFASIQSAFVDWIYTNHFIEVGYSPLLEVYSNPGESADQFKARVATTAREMRDKAIEELRAKTAKSIKSLQDKMTKALDKMEQQKAQASSAKLQTVMQIGGSILGALLGRKSGLGAIGGLARTSTVSSASRAWKEGKEAASAEEELERLKVDYEQIQQDVENDIQKLRDQYDPATLVIETQKITPVKKNIQPLATGILWLPYERRGEDLRRGWAQPT